MATREDSVYLAKLAEQAERYEGGLFLGHVMALFTFFPVFLTRRWDRNGREHEERRFF